MKDSSFMPAPHKMRNKESFSIPFLLVLLSTCVFSATSKNADAAENKLMSTLWSDDENCAKNGALFIAIESDEDSYKLASCVKYGCRIAVREFGKKSHSGNFREDPRFHWFSDHEFETVINGETRRLYFCFAKSGS